MLRSFVTALVAGLVLSGCATQPTENKVTYTARDHKALTYCMGLSDTAKAVAFRKSQGQTAEEVHRYYESKGAPEIVPHVVDKVYKEFDEGIWDYTVGFYKECAGSLAGISGDALRPAQFCFQEQMISSLVYDFKAQGTARATVKKHFDVLPAGYVNAIVDDIYASNEDRADVGMRYWERCMSKYQ